MNRKEASGLLGAVAGDSHVRLVPLAAADAPDMLALAQDPEIVRFTPVPPGADREFVRGWIERYERGKAHGESAGYAIRDARTDAFLGFACILEIDLEAGRAELGYMVARDARGRGVASSALEVLAERCFGELGLTSLVLRIVAENHASKRVASKAGFRLDDVLRDVELKPDVHGDLELWVAP